MNESSGCVVWLTGLPGAGKTTIARLVEKQLREKKVKVEVLDGDEVRANLSPDLGFTRQDRETHARRVVYISQLLARNEVVSLVSLISPYREIRKYARDSIGSNFIEVWVKASSEICRARDPKGLYKKARAGEVSRLTGVQDPYEPPIAPEVTLETERESADESASKLLKYLDAYIAKTRSSVAQ